MFGDVLIYLFSWWYCPLFLEGVFFCLFCFVLFFVLLIFLFFFLAGLVGKGSVLSMMVNYASLLKPWSFERKCSMRNNLFYFNGINAVNQDSAMTKSIKLHLLSGAFPIKHMKKITWRKQINSWSHSCYEAACN